jgi:hypothetical protein
MSDQNFSDELRGALFKNKNKRPDKKDPDYTGLCEIEGVKYYVDSWVNTPKAGGDKFLSLRFKPKTPKTESANSPSVSSDVDFLDDEIPF